MRRHLVCRVSSHTSVTPHYHVPPNSLWQDRLNDCRNMHSEAPIFQRLVASTWNWVQQCILMRNFRAKRNDSILEYLNLEWTHSINAAIPCFPDFKSAGCKYSWNMHIYNSYPSSCSRFLHHSSSNVEFQRHNPKRCEINLYYWLFDRRK